MIFGFYWWTNGSYELVDGIQEIKGNFCAPSKIREIVASNACIHFLYCIRNGSLGGAQIAIFLDCVAGAKRGAGVGREKSAKEGKRKGSLPFFPQSRSLFPFLPIPTPFDACYAGYYFSAGKARAEKSVCSPQATGCGIQEEVCCDWLNAFNKSF